MFDEKFQNESNLLSSFGRGEGLQCCLLLFYVQFFVR